jgi:Domain of unknown function (DUF397)
MSEWCKSSYSDREGNCIELRPTEDGVDVRDSKQGGAGPILSFTRSEFLAFLAGAKAGEFDHLA